MRFTAVWLMPPPAGIDPSKAPAAFAAPVASSSVLGRGAGSPGATNARPTAAVSVKLMSAMPSAAGQSSSASDFTSARSGIVSDGSPEGIAPTSSTPCAGRSSQVTPAMATAIAISGAGQPCRNFSMPPMIAIVSTPTATVAHDRWPSPVAISCRLCSSDPLAKWMPRIFGQLIDDDHGADAGLEPDQHGLGNETGHEAEPGRWKPAPGSRPP